MLSERALRVRDACVERSGLQPAPYHAPDSSYVPPICPKLRNLGPWVYVSNIQCNSSLNMTASIEDEVVSCFNTIKGESIEFKPATRLD